jgi:hypothetical protein
MAATQYALTGSAAVGPFTPLAAEFATVLVLDDTHIFIAYADAPGVTLLMKVFEVGTDGSLTQVASLSTAFFGLIVAPGFVLPGGQIFVPLLLFTSNGPPVVAGLSAMLATWDGTTLTATGPIQIFAPVAHGDNLYLFASWSLMPNGDLELVVFNNVLGDRYNLWQLHRSGWGIAGTWTILFSALPTGLNGYWRALPAGLYSNAGFSVNQWIFVGYASSVVSVSAALPFVAFPTASPNGDLVTLDQHEYRRITLAGVLAYSSTALAHLPGVPALSGGVAANRGFMGRVGNFRDALVVARDATAHEYLLTYTLDQTDQILASSPAAQPLGGVDPFSGAVHTMPVGTRWLVHSTAGLRVFSPIGLSATPIPLRLAQRNDGLGTSAHPRLNGSTSTQTSTAPRVGGNNTYS